MSSEELRRLSEAATAGRWGSFGMALFAGDSGEVDTSTHIATFHTERDGHPRTFDLDFAIALVNAYRAGELRTPDELHPLDSGLDEAADRVLEVLSREGWVADDQATEYNLRVAALIVEAVALALHKQDATEEAGKS